jgi:hypothetical protein
VTTIPELGKTIPYLASSGIQLQDLGFTAGSAAHLQEAERRESTTLCTLGRFLSPPHQMEQNALVDLQSTRHPADLATMGRRESLGKERIFCQTPRPIPS